MFEGRPQEALAMVTAQGKYIGQALRAGYYALKNEQSVLDNTSRLEVDMRAVSRQGAGLLNFEEGRQFSRRNNGKLFRWVWC